jgi:hypothetical protein
VEGVEEVLKKVGRMVGGVRGVGTDAGTRGRGDAAMGDENAGKMPAVQGEAAPGEETAGGMPAVQGAVARVEVRALRGLALAEADLLGAILVEPVLFEKVRQDVMLGMFETFAGLAGALMEYFENQSELAECKLPEILSVLEETAEAGRTELVRQAVELEARTADWVESANLSPAHVKLLEHLTKDRGVSLETLARDAIRELQAARGKVDMRAEADLGGAVVEGERDEEAEMMRELKAIQERNASGGNRRVV